jgi:hypothetical protein
VICSLRTYVNFHWTTQHYFPGQRILHSHWCKKIRFNKQSKGFYSYKARVYLSTAFWDIKTCRSLKVNKNFVGTECHNSGGQRSHAIYHHGSMWKAGTLLSLFDPEHGGGVFPQNLGDFHWTTWHYIREDITFHYHCCGNLKSYKITSIQQLSILEECLSSCFHKVIKWNSNVLYVDITDLILLMHLAILVTAVQTVLIHHLIQIQQRRNQRNMVRFWIFLQ